MKALYHSLKASLPAGHWILFYVCLYSAAYAGPAAYGAPTAYDVPPAYSGPLVPGKIIDSVICSADHTQSYAVYIPVKGRGGAKGDTWPVIYFFDPHADGRLPLAQYKTLADRYGFILIGSNNSKNGNDWHETENIWRRLREDTRARLTIDKDRIYTAGFSGGAKVAGYEAIMNPEVKGVIVGGAGLPDGTTADDFSFSFTVLAGEGDMNLTELMAINEELDHTKTRHRIIYFDGKHEWAPANSMDAAFAGLQFDAIRAGRIQKDDAFIGSYIAKSKRRLEGYEKMDQPVRAVGECRLSMNLLDGVAPGPAAWFARKADSLTGSAQYKQQRNAQDQLMEVERNAKEQYMQHFQGDDNGYWNTTIDGLKINARAATAEGTMYQRLLAYLSLAFYSFSNRLINGKEYDAARHFVQLYKMADPGNSEAWYFSAILDAREGHTKTAESDLLKAVECGFRDKERMRHQPEFQNLSQSLDFAAIEGRMQTKQIRK